MDGYFFCSEEVELQSKTVQEVFNSNANASATTYVDTPIIDLQLLKKDESSPLAKQELQKLRDALSSWGCFQLVNHGVATSLIPFVGNDFFALPEEAKEKYSTPANSYEGYVGHIVSEDQPTNWNDKLQIRTHPVEQRNFKMWPENVQNFRETLEDYSSGARNVLEGLLKAIAKSLDLEENVLLSKFGDDGDIFTRFNFCPPCPVPNKVIGLKPHSDASLVTILLLDSEVEGLHVCKDDEWYKVPIIPDALFILAGDQLEIMSNGLMKTAVHKVVTNKERARLSVAVPCSMHRKEIAPLSELISANRPQLYKNVKNFVDTYLNSARKGESATEAIKIY